MKKRLIRICLVAAVCFLCGCGSVFDKEYVVVSDYVPPAQDNVSREDKITVRDLNELKAALLGLVSSGEDDGAIQFDAAYQGDTAADMASACWQVRTQDALCAYCVDNISYELSKIVNHYEAEISIHYSPAALNAADIRQMQYSTGIEDIIRSAMEAGNRRLVILITRSFYSGEEMESLVGRVYRSYPASAPAEPKASVNMFSGSGRQRLYEILLDYGMTGEELEARRAELLALEPFRDADTEMLDPAHRALLAADYLVDNCVYAADSQGHSAYAALVGQEADSEGMALAYVELCRRLEVPCQIVYGQKNRENHSWNIIELDEKSYHVDLTACQAQGMPGGFLLRDEEAWVSYRWDTAAYPVCDGPLHYQALLAQPEGTPEAGAEETAEPSEEILNGS